MRRKQMTPSLATKERSTATNIVGVLDADNELIEHQMRNRAHANDGALRLAQSRLSRAVETAKLNFEGRPYPVSLRPLALTARQASDLGSIGERFVDLLDTAARLYCEDKDARDLFPAYRNVDHLATKLPKLKPLTRICRLDGLLAPDGSYRILETNTDSPGGIIQNGRAGQIWAEIVNPLKDGLALDIDRQPFVKSPDCFLRELLAAHRERTGQSASRAAIVNYRGRFTNEIEWMVDGLIRLGVETMLVDAATLRRGPHSVIDTTGRPIELAYNKFDLRDIIDEPEVAAYLEGAAAGDITFLNPLICQWPLNDKAILALLQDQRFSDYFTPAERALIKDHVPWTRFVRAGRTGARDGKRIDLLPYVAENRESLVLKPSNATRGEGVLVGRFTAQAQWEAQLSRAAAGTPYVVQDYIEAPRISAPHPTDGSIAQMWAGLDVYVYGGRFAGFQSRASLDPVMNVGMRGILLPVVVAEGM
jgi:hypothetical protein